MWKILQALVLFATAGFIFAKDFFLKFGIDADSPLVIAIGLGITTMLINRSPISILVMVLFGIMVNLSDDTLESYNLDRDIILAAAICTLFLPWIQRVVNASR